MRGNSEELERRRWLAKAYLVALNEKVNRKGLLFFTFARKTITIMKEVNIMKWKRGYYSGYGYVVVYEENGRIKKMEFATASEAEEYFRKGPGNTNNVPYPKR